MTPRDSRRSAFGSGIATLSVCLISVAAVCVSLVAQQPADRSAPPALGTVQELKLPPIQKRMLSNSLPVWLVEAHEVPLVQISLLVKAGSGDDAAGKFGLASLTAAMLDEGAGSHSALEIADEIEFLGADLGTTSSFDASAVRLNVPVSRLGAALPVMADVALRPTFPTAELERLRQERLTALLQARDDAASVAPMAFARLLFGPSHRYGTGTMGTEATLKGFTTEDLKAFHSAMFQPGRATLIVAGDVTLDSILPQLEMHFGSWRGGPASATRSTVPNAPQPPQGQITIVDMPGAAQSQIRIGWVGVPRSTPDYFTLQVLNTILGGSFTSRLNQNLREQHGYTYGAGSSFSMRKSAGPFLASSGVQTEVTSEAVKEFFNEFTGILKPVPADELSKARNYVALAYPGGFESVGGIAGQIEEMLTYGLPPDYFNTYVSKIQTIGGDQLLKAAAKYILPDRFAVVVVGDRQKIEAGLRALKLGTVTVMTIDQALGPAVPVQ